MNRALFALLAFAALVAAGLLWLRFTLPPPELPALPEMFPAETVAYVEIRDPGRWLAAGGLAAWPELRRQMLARPLAAVAAGVVDFRATGGGLEPMAVAESPAAAALARAIGDALREAGWAASEHRSGPASWTRFERDGHAPLTLYAGRGTLGLAAGGRILEALVAGKRHAATTLGQDPGLQAARLGAPSGDFAWLRPGQAGRLALDLQSGSGAWGQAVTAELRRSLGMDGP